MIANPHTTSTRLYKPERTNVMTETHPNVTLLSRLNLADIEACADIIADDFIWHYFNPKLPDLQGDYAGPKGLQDFFRKLHGRSNGKFKVNPIDIRTVGDELVIVQVRNRMELDAEAFEVDAIVVWRVVNGKLAEAWDIPAIHHSYPVDSNRND